MATTVVNLPTNADNGAMIDPLDDLLSEARVFYHTLVRVGERLHENEELSLGMRAILERLVADGPQTVPDMARARRVTRQRIQALVDALKHHGYVQASPNPAHRRSVVIELTADGRQIIARMQRREQNFLAANVDPGADPAVSNARIAAAVDTLRVLGEQLEGGL